MLIEIADRLEYSGNHDSLTGVYNRRYLWEWLKLQFLLAKRQRYDISCLLLEIDDFEDVTKSGVKKEADSLLVEMTRLIQILLRKLDILVRFSENRFVALLPCCHVDDALMAAKKVCTLVNGVAIL